MRGLFDLSDEPKERVYTVSEISKLIKKTLETNFASVWVEGELGKVSIPASGHIYLTLKDGEAALSANLWKQKRSMLTFDLEEGMMVLARGRISSYAPRGNYNLIIDKIEPSGIGALQLRFEQLKKKLAAKGYFDEERKKTLPQFPKSIGIVTSATGAAFKDIARILKRRDPGVRIILAPVMVEGEQAKYAVAQAIDDFNSYGNIDLMVVGRGGGSPESLWAFNEEEVADSIYRSKIPVISAVGHEIDFTISDMVADLRASTPSAAAELAVKERRDVVYTVETFQKRMAMAIGADLKEFRNRLNDLLTRTPFADPARFLENSRERVDENLTRIVQAVKRNRADFHNLVVSLGKQLRLLRPENLVRRKIQSLDALRQKLNSEMIGLLSEKRMEFAEASAMLPGVSPLKEIRRKREAVLSLEKMLAQKARMALSGQRQKLATAGGRLDALSPLKVLERGYSIASKSSGEVIKDSSQIEIGEKLDIRLSRGGLNCEVKSKESN